MKRAILAMALLGLFLSACSGEDASTAGNAGQPTPAVEATQAPAAEAEATAEPSAEPTTAPTAEPTAEPTPEPAADPAAMLEFSYAKVRLQYPPDAEFTAKEDGGATIARILEDGSLGAVMMLTPQALEGDNESFIASKDENLKILGKSLTDNYDNAKIVESGVRNVGVDPGIPMLYVDFTADVNDTPYFFVAYAFVFEDQLLQITTMCSEAQGELADFAARVLGTVALPDAAGAAE